ncbi:hypothetical protein BX600DRAFT_531180 [Xylariales sp. PMI_506]|nr:hypothetical protein BX600DRAFT_531180 [Xylariales sp. PMI_506]
MNLTWPPFNTALPPPTRKHPPQYNFNPHHLRYLTPNFWLHTFLDLRSLKMHTVSIWFECGHHIKCFAYTFAETEEFLSPFVYPADLFCQLQPLADELDLDWDPDVWEVQVLRMRDRRLRGREAFTNLTPDSPFSDATAARVLRSDTLVASEVLTPELIDNCTCLEGLSKEEFAIALRDMAAREWNDVLYVRDLTPERRRLNRELCEAITRISHLDLAE